jgi:hypothetical protein
VIYSESGHRFLQYSYPVQDPVTAAAMGLIPVEMIPVELDIESLYETQDRRRKKSGNGKDVPPHVHSVGSRYTRTVKKEADGSTSVGALRIERRSGRFVTGRRSV